MFCAHTCFQFGITVGSAGIKPVGYCGRCWVQRTRLNVSFLCTLPLLLCNFLTVLSTVKDIVSVVDEWMNVDHWWNNTDGKGEVIGEGSFLVPLCQPKCHLLIASLPAMWERFCIRTLCCVYFLRLHQTLQWSR